MSLIFGLPWKHPAAVLFLSVLIVGGVAIYIEGVVPIGVNGASAHRGGAYLSLAVLGLFVWDRIILHMITFPEEYLPKRSLTLDAQIYERRERFVQYLGYGFGISTLLFAIFKIFSLAPFL